MISSSESNQARKGRLVDALAIRGDGKPTFMMFCNLLLFYKVINIQNILKSTFNLNKIKF